MFLVNTICKLYQVRRHLVNLTRAKLHLNQRPATVSQDNNGICLEACLVTIIMDHTLPFFSSSLGVEAERSMTDNRAAYRSDNFDTILSRS